MADRKLRRTAFRWAPAVLAAVVVLDGLAWWTHVRWREAAMDALQPVVRQIDTLEAQIREDDRWIERNGKLFQEYGRHEQFKARLRARGNRARAHDALVDSYNREVNRLYRRRFYLAPLPPPPPPLRSLVSVR